MCNAAPLRVAANGQTAQQKSQPAKSPLSLQQMPGTTVANVEDKDGKLAASGALVRYSNNQGYFVLQHLDEKLQRKAVLVSTPDINEPLNLRIDGVEDSLPSRSHLPMYIQVHHNAPERLLTEHLIDNLAEAILGRQNLELKKNVTIDLFDSDSDTYLRDRVGFFVADRQQFRELKVNAKDALEVLKKDGSVSVQKFSPSDLQDIADYDNTLSAQTRTEYVQFLSQKCKIFVAKPKAGAASTVVSEEDEENQEKLNISGYLVVGGEKSEEKVLALYAQTSEIAETLLAGYLSGEKVKGFTFCSLRQHWPKLVALKSTSERPIYRRHTRAVPSNVKWDRIFAVNIGMNLF